MSDDRPALSVVAPCFNEEAVLPEFLRRSAPCSIGVGGSAEIVLVDDGSRDGTWQAMSEAAARDRASSRCG
jgi:dolichol-phosphate mannosyltransferase